MGTTLRLTCERSGAGHGQRMHLQRIMLCIWMTAISATSVIAAADPALPASAAQVVRLQIDPLTPEQERALLRDGVVVTADIPGPWAAYPESATSADVVSLLITPDLAWAVLMADFERAMALFEAQQADRAVAWQRELLRAMHVVMVRDGATPPI